MCRRAQKARPSLQLLLKLVTSIFWGKGRETGRQRERGGGGGRERARESTSKTNKRQEYDSEDDIVIWLSDRTSRQHQDL